MSTKSFITLFMAVFFITACSSQNTTVKNLNATDFEKQITQNSVQLVDVRTPEEFKEKHIEGAQNINYNDASFQNKLSGLDKSKPLYIYCLAGGRSKKAADQAVALGFNQVYNLEFGINSWISENKPVTNSTGEKVNTSSIGMSFDDYLNHIKQSPKLVIVDFNAVRFGPCKILKPRVQKIVKKYNDKVELFDIDVDKNSTVANTMNVKGIPFIIFYKQGKEVWRNMGLIEEELLNEKVVEFTK